jgi:hypothetical protein
MNDNMKQRYMSTRGGDNDRERESKGKIDYYF